MNAKLEALNQEIEKTEKKLRRAQHEEKILEHQIKTLTRKERTHRLCTRAAMLESYLPHPEAITDKQVSLFLALGCQWRWPDGHPVRNTGFPAPDREI